MSKSIWHRYDEAPKHQDIIMTDTGCWAYRADLLALETENKHLSDKIGQLETDLERTRKALDKAKWWLKEIVESHRCTPISTAEMALAEIKNITEKDAK